MLAALAFLPTHADAAPSNAVDLRTRYLQRAPGRLATQWRVAELELPPWCKGTWMATSTLRSITAPAGYKLFGRTGSYEAARDTIGQPLVYKARFLRSGGLVVPDRAYNVACIAEAALGDGSVLSCSDDGARLSVRAVDGSVCDVRLLPLARVAMRGMTPTDEGGDVLYTAELVRQTVNVQLEDLRTQTSVKEVETITVWLDNSSDDVVQSLQRTATYLPRSDLRYVDAKGRPIDIRWYDVVYQRS